MKDSLLKEFLEYENTTDLKKRCGELLLFYFKKVEDYPLFLYAVGEIPMCLVAHMDTVERAGVELVQERNRVWNAQGVLGADDRAGIFAIFEILWRLKRERLPMPSVLFTDLEEKGGKGVKAFLEADVWSGKDRLFIELDRQGANEYVFYTRTIPVQVMEYVESFGFIKNEGVYSDIADISREYLVPGVNISVGYHKQHSAKEKLHIDELYMTISRVFSMCKEPIDDLYPVEEDLIINDALDWDYRLFDYKLGIADDLDSFPIKDDLAIEILQTCTYADPELLCERCPDFEYYDGDYLYCARHGTFTSSGLTS